MEAFRFVAFNDPNWDPLTFNASADIDRLESKATGFDPPGANLKPFFAHGGKLLMYHGWADQQVAPLNSVTYVDAVLNASGKSAGGKSIALYMVPGMGHCSGGAGTATFDKVAAMEQWIATGRAPAQIIASHQTAGKTDRTRPLCPYPQVAKYKGTGSTDDAANFPAPRRKIQRMTAKMSDHACASMPGRRLLRQAASSPKSRPYAVILATAQAPS